ncbi:MAG TPA: DUF3465 domain-containing protein [Dongiaceae bacterium]|nr:DUF3465 domain-containing protein [Dongiaceae bacterium]
MEVRYSGTVTSRPIFFTSRHSHHTHERFDVRADDGSAFQVVDNVSLAPRVPVRPGDRVTVQGELIHAGGRALVHWTHHDPRGRHAGGFVMLGGHTYA